MGRQGVKWAAIIKKPMIILTFLVKKCQKAMVKLNPEPESIRVYGYNGQLSSKNHDNIDIFDHKVPKSYGEIESRA